MRDLVEHTAIMIVWPRRLPGTHYTPSPFMDELKRKSNELKLQAAELNEAQSKLGMQQLIEEESSHNAKRRGKARKAKPAGECSE